MKAFLLVCLAVAAYADPQVLLNPYSVSPLTTFYRQPLTYVATQPILKVQEERPVDPEKKVEVEVESYSAEKPEQKVVVNPLAYTSNILGQPLIYNTQPIVQKVQVVPRFQSKNGDVEHTVYKREAEPFWPFSSIYPTTFYSNPLVNSNVAVAQPVIYKQETVDPLANVNAKTYANNFHPFGRNYAAKGRYVADSVGARHVAKREAEADPQFLAYASTINPWAYSPLRTVYNSWAYNNVAAVPLTGQTISDSRFQTAQAYGARGQYVANSGGAVHIA